MTNETDIDALKNTHLMDWLKQGHSHCQYGSREWCEAYLTSAHDYILALEAENKRLRSPPSEDDIGTTAYMAGLEKGKDAGITEGAKIGRKVLDWLTAIKDEIDKEARRLLGEQAYREFPRFVSSRLDYAIRASKEVK